MLGVANMNAVDELQKRFAADLQRQFISRLWTHNFVIAMSVWAVLVVLATCILGAVAYVWSFIIFFFGVSCISWWAYWRAKRQVNSASR